MTDATAPHDTTPGLIEARATVNLAGLPAGRTVLVDPNHPYVADCLRGGYLVPVSGEGER